MGKLKDEQVFHAECFCSLVALSKGRLRVMAETLKKNSAVFLDTGIRVNRASWGNQDHRGVQRNLIKMRSREEPLYVHPLFSSL